MRVLEGLEEDCLPLFVSSESLGTFTAGGGKPHAVELPFPPALDCI